MKDQILIINTPMAPSGTGIVAAAPEMFDPTSNTRAHLASKGITFENDQQVWDYIKRRHNIPLSEPTVDRSVLPQSRYFRDAWKKNGQTIDIDRPTAEDIRMADLRTIRSKGLEVLDREYMLADEKSNLEKKREVADKKQTLRDMPKNTDMSSLSIEELETFVPAELQEYA